MRRCSKCEEDKLEVEFYDRERNRTGSVACIPCLKSIQRQSRRTNRYRVLIVYSQDPPSCICCGETHFEFLTIDHINGGGEAHRKSIGGPGRTMDRWLRLNGYPDGFRVLCYNCNNAIGRYGYCPHKEETNGSVSYNRMDGAARAGL